MTDDEINKAIAEACRWKLLANNRWTKPCGIYADLPNYTADLNAMHEAEKVLVGKNNWELCEYVHKLHTATNSWIAFATARQRAEAFLKTLNLWKE